MQEYEAADRCIDRLLQMEPNNYQAKQLKDLIVKKLTRGYNHYSACILLKSQEGTVVYCKLPKIESTCSRLSEQYLVD